MPINTNYKIDYLWKKVIYQNAETSTNKQGYEESIPSPRKIYNTQIWQHADQIPVPAQAVPNIVQDNTVVPVPLIVDITVATGQNFIAYSNGLHLGDWIPFTFDPSYEIKVYLDAGMTNRLLEGQIGSEWVFDYDTGILNFPNTPPAGSPQVLYITGYRYIGSKGVGLSSFTTGQTATVFAPGQATIISSSQAANPSRPVSGLVPGQNATQFPLYQGDIVYFTLPSGPKVVLQSLQTNLVCQIECHSTAQFNDTNPYIFAAYTGHLVDDGSYLDANGNFYGGNRFVWLFNLDQPQSNYTYWKLISLSGLVSGTLNAQPQHFTMQATVFQMN